MFNQEREREIEEQRRGLSLAAIFPKPRPVWAAPALVGLFGDPFIEGTLFEGCTSSIELCIRDAMCGAEIGCAASRSKLSGVVVSAHPARLQAHVSIPFPP